jgi:hypothetical protein
MGMDLESINKKTGFHANWFGWENLHRLLKQLGCDVYEIRWANDGAIVRKETCVAWYIAIIKNLAINKIKNLYVTDSSYYGQSYNQMVFADLHKDKELTDLPEHDMVWLKEFCTFLINCNGFKQF